MWWRCWIIDRKWSTLPRVWMLYSIVMSETAGESRLLICAKLWLYCCRDDYHWSLGRYPTRGHLICGLTWCWNERRKLGFFFLALQYHSSLFWRWIFSQGHSRSIWVTEETYVIQSLSIGSSGNDVTIVHALCNWQNRSLCFALKNSIVVLEFLRWV